MVEKIICSDCKAECVIDFQTGEVVCKHCGLVQNDIIIKDEAYEW